MKLKPAGVNDEPILCPTCLASLRPQKLWLDFRDMTLVCPVHDSVWVYQEVEGLTKEDS
jgi:hypothetical protein